MKQNPDVIGVVYDFPISEKNGKRIFGLKIFSYLDTS
jgi:hypothetical protein